jgi:CheY-like chemotaxis protein
MPRHLVLEDDLPSPGPAVSAIPGQLQLVLTNLVTNACETGAPRKGGKVRVSVRTVAAADIPTIDRFPASWTPRDESYACVSVTDPGGGFDKAVMEQVFDPFFSTKAFGRGLGLSVALGAVRAHGGAIAIRGGAGAESTVEVYLPAWLGAAPEPRRTEDVDAAPRSLRGGTVLVVDDEALVRTMATRVLRHLGYDALVAGGGAEAVALFEEHRQRISWVLCDVTMDGMNGWETLAAFRAVDPDVQVVLTSGFDEAQAMSEGGAMAPPRAVLPKPWTFAQLLEVAP